MPLPDVWLEPRVVWEVKGAALSLSPVHTAGADIIHEKRGIRMRFPPVVREQMDARRKRYDKPKYCRFVLELVIDDVVMSIYWWW